MNIRHFFKVHFPLKNIAYVAVIFCMLILISGMSSSDFQLYSANGVVNLRNQSLYGDNNARLYWDSNNSTTSQIVIRDKEGEEYGRIHANNNGGDIGIIEADGHWTYRAKKDEYTQLKINNVEIMRLLAGGGVGIGTSSVPSGYRLAVDGKGIFEEVRVKPSNSWDEVFMEDYDLMSIEEKEVFTKENHHLPSVEPECVVVSEGMDIGKSYTDLLKEVEEAHMYIFQLNHTVKELKQELENKDNLQQQLDELKKQFNKMK